ncbi:MAG: ABC transporter permease [Odoribacter sp.]|nr:ABC transporter permease [Odoribacter sp.]
MYWGNLKIFWRNLKKQKTVGALSIGSLAVAVAVVVLIGLWAVNEFRFDGFHKDKDKIYRVIGLFTLNGEQAKTGATYKKAGEDGLRTFPEVQAMCRIAPVEYDISVNDVLYPQREVFLADSSFFSFFSFALKAGNPRTCLSAPDGMVIDEYAANSYFPGEDPMGKTIRMNGKDFTVVGLMENMPVNSHLKAHIVAQFTGYWVQPHEYGQTDAFMTYFKIADPVSLPKIEQGMTDIIWQAQPLFKQLDFRYRLQPLQDVYFDKNFKFDNVVHGNKSLVMVFVLTAFVILLIACINFINLFVSTSFLRAKSIGVRKTHGADKGRLMGEFYWETFCYVMLSVVIGTVLAVLALPLFNRLADSQLTIDFTGPLLYVFLVALVFVVMLTAGTFPALYMTKFNAVETLKGQFKGKNLSFLQKGLIIIQFTAAIVILISVFFIEKQVSYMIHKDLGFDKENVFYVADRGGFIRNYDAFCQEMLSHSSIVGVTLKDTDPLGWCRGDVVRRSGSEQEYLMEFCEIKPNYFRLMGMDMKAGKEFAEGAGDSLRYCIINETAARTLGLLSDAVGEKLLANGYDYTIYGVVKDAHTKSLHQPVDPQIYFPYEGVYGYPAMFFRVQGNPQEAIRLVQSKWNDLNPGTPFDYHFLDQSYAQLYKAETNAENILSAAMAVTLVISVAGLFAMAYYTTQRRLKEVGVRKVNGASVKELLLLLNRDFFVWVGISYLLACPLAFLFMKSWLEGFVERTTLSWWVFVLAGAVTFVVTLLTVSYQTWQASNVNPVKCLKDE